MQINKLDKAVAAANTFFIANPDHVEMKQNLEYYSLMAGVQQADFKDLEEKPHMVRVRILIWVDGLINTVNTQCYTVGHIIVNIEVPAMHTIINTKFTTECIEWVKNILYRLLSARFLKIYNF